jgi:hypothetical protein
MHQSGSFSRVIEKLTGRSGSKNRWRNGGIQRCPASLKAWSATLDWLVLGGKTWGSGEHEVRALGKETGRLSQSDFHPEGSRDPQKNYKHGSARSL